MKQRKIGSPVWSQESGREQKLGSEIKKTYKNHARVIFHLFAGKPPLGQSVWILAY